MFVWGEQCIVYTIYWKYKKNILLEELNGYNRWIQKKRLRHESVSLRANGYLQSDGVVFEAEHVKFGFI